MKPSDINKWKKSFLKKYGPYLECAFEEEEDTNLGDAIVNDIDKLLASQLSWLEVEIKKFIGELVVDNWDDGKPRTCNPRCHDSGKEDGYNTALALLSQLRGGGVK